MTLSLSTPGRKCEWGPSLPRGPAVEGVAVADGISRGPSPGDPYITRFCVRAGEGAGARGPGVADAA